MAENTGIEWTERTWNPVIGCAKVSAGCKHCYAETMAKRIVAMGNKDYPAVVGPDGKWNGKGKFLPHRLAEPMKWSKPCRVFVNSMSDLFHENITNEQIAAVFGVMAATRHTYQVLTKRPERALEWFRWIAEVGEACTDPWTECHWAALLVEKLSVGDGGPIHCKGPAQSDDVARPWPLPNVWIGVSVENQEQADKRIPLLLQIPAKVRFLSCEPLLGSVDLAGWGPCDSLSQEGSWSDFEWPEWVPIEQRTMIERFWGQDMGRGPKDWVRDHKIQRVPITGTTFTVEIDKDGWAKVDKMASKGVMGKYLHCWNNIGRVVTDDGHCIPASGGHGTGWFCRWLDAGAYRHRLHWIIVGGESGPGARSCDVQWIRDIVAQCKAAGVACFVKQLGANVIDRNDASFDGNSGTFNEETQRWEIDGWPDGVYPDMDTTEDYQGAPVRVLFKSRKGGDPEEWPPALRVREFPEWFDELPVEGSVG